MRLFARSAGRLGPIDAEHQEPLSWSVECSTVAFSWFSSSEAICLLDCLRRRLYLFREVLSC